MATAFSDTTFGKIFNFIIGREKKKHSHGDPTREVFETIVFVVVLVLMLKLFVAEAFVIPTGSMATTLLGDNVKVTCPECGHNFPLSAALQAGRRPEPSSATCQNCGHSFPPTNKRDWNSGDRVLVAKYEYHVRSPRRFDVPVFKYPQEPYHVSDKTAMNYIKRLCGLPGETLAIYKGDLYVNDRLTYPGRPRPERDLDLWQINYTYAGDAEAVALFQKGGFRPIRKTPEEILVVRRLVFDLDQQPKSLTGIARTRWHATPGEDGAGWAMEEKGFTHSGMMTGWMRYHHVEPGWENGSALRQPVPITDHLGYNSHSSTQPYWVPDLIVDCTAEFKAATDKVVLELTKAGEKFRAEFDNGVCRLFHVSSAADEPVMIAEQKTAITGAGKRDLRFANVDSRLTVWVDNRPLDFGDKADYPPPSRESFKDTVADTHEPARIGATGNVTISKVSLWRDVYYTPGQDPKNPAAELPISTYYVQPGHYFCLGDNSASSADGRTWGLVPERLMLGRAVVVYWPPSRIGVIK